MHKNRKQIAAIGGVVAMASVALLAVLSTPQPSLGRAPDEVKYIGSKKCKKCHSKQFKSWAKTKMANCYDVLAPGERADIKTKNGLDPQKDYRKDEKCLKCHTVGFGKPGGFSMDYDVAKDKKRLLGVGCESCHGPGGGYVGKGLKDKDYKDPAVHDERLPALIAKGFHPKPKKEDCTQCHNKESPNFQEFDFEKRQDEGTHEHFKKK